MAFDKLDRQTAALREIMEYTSPEVKNKLIEKYCTLLVKWRRWMRRSSTPDRLSRQLLTTNRNTHSPLESVYLSVCRCGVCASVSVKFAEFIDSNKKRQMCAQRPSIILGAVLLIK